MPFFCAGRCSSSLNFKDSVRLLHYLRDQSLEGCFAEGNHISSLLAHALADAIYNQNIEEMAVLCRKILTSDTLEGPEISAIEDFIAAVVHRTRRAPETTCRIAHWVPARGKYTAPGFSWCGLCAVFMFFLLSR